MDISIIGGTGDEGFGLTLRLARAGHHVTIGSRSQEKGSASAEKARELLGGDANVDGTTNEAAADAGVVIVTVPFEGQAETYRTIKGAVAARHDRRGLHEPARDRGGRASVARRAAVARFGGRAGQGDPRPGVRMVAAFHTISGEALQDLEHEMESDVLVCGTDKEAKAVVGGLIEDIPRLRWVDAGDLTQARIAETLTALLISINRTYKIHDAGVRITGRDAWGAPGASA